MSEVVLGDLDRVVHEPARLAILTVLRGTPKADFVFLRRLLGLTQGNLSSHLTRLDAAGLVTLEKASRGIGPRTFIRITDAGRRAVDEHWRRLDALRDLGTAGR